MSKSSQHINHLYRRAGFGLSPQEWKERRDWSVQQAVRQLFTEADLARRRPLGVVPPLPDRATVMKMSKKEKKELRIQGRKIQSQQIKAWTERMASSNESALLEKITLFWHGHFACVIQGQPHLSLQYLQTLRHHALGNFRDLLLAVARDPAMIRFLNNQQNRKRHPNENFARELMELFTIGRGHYSEKDVKEAARAFTGWSSNFKGEYVFRLRQHDYGPKTFLGKTGNFNGEDIIDILLAQTQTAYFIAGKFYRFFVNDQLDKNRVKELADRLLQSDYDIADLLRYLFTVDWFYAAEHRGAKIKSPIELLAGVMRTFQVHLEQPATTIFIQKALGQLLFHPPNVAGWPGGRHWIDHSTLMLRLNLTAYLFQATEVSFKVKENLKAQKRNRVVRKIDAEIDLTPLLQTFTGYSENSLFEELCQYFLALPAGIPLEKFRPYLIRQNEEDLIKTLVLRITSLPEYQVC